MDLDFQQFQEFGKAAIDLIANYLENIRTRDVLPSVEPGNLVKCLPSEAPDRPECWQEIIKDFQDLIIPGITHWQSPQFHAFYPGGQSFASIVGSILSSGLGVVGFSWLASPAATELEVVTMNWLGKLLGLPEEFLNCSEGPGGGVIQSTASAAALVGLLVAKDRTIRRLKNLHQGFDEDLIKTKLVAYTSDQCNPSIEKAGKLGGVRMRLLRSDTDGKLRGKTLREAIETDKSQGLIPCYYVATLGTTNTCAFDPLHELGPVCREHGVWLHVDAAYAGAAFICPEYRHLMRGVEYADSFDVNAHKWLLVNFDCSCMWVKNGYDVIRTFDVQRVYLNDIKTSIKIPDYRHWQIPLTRDFKALKLWLILKMYGADGLRSHIRGQIELAQHFEQLVRKDERFLVEPEPIMALVCFRLKEGDNSTKKLLNNLTEKKKVFMVQGSYQGKLVIRFAVCSRMTKKTDIEYSWSLIKEEAAHIGCSEIATEVARH